MAALADFAKYVRPAAPGCPEPVLLDAILRSCIAFCERTEWLTETILLATEADKAGYALTTSADTVADKLLRVWRGIDDDLDPSSRLAFEDDGLDRRSGIPTDYYLEGDDLLMLGPIPEAVETLSVKVAVKPAEDAATVPDALRLHWAIEIAAGAKALLMNMKNTAWYDAVEATTQSGIFLDGIDRANSQRAKGRGKRRLRVVGSFF